MSKKDYVDTIQSIWNPLILILSSKEQWAPYLYDFMKYAFLFKVDDTLKAKLDAMITHLLLNVHVPLVPKKIEDMTKKAIVDEIDEQLTNFIHPPDPNQTKINKHGKKSRRRSNRKLKSKKVSRVPRNK